MTCAKKRVFCHIVTKGMEVFVGENVCSTPQLFCPREGDEGYEKCKTVCNQESHAEINALKAAGEKAKGAYSIVSGINYMCKDCQIALIKAGIKEMRIKP